MIDRNENITGYDNIIQRAIFSNTLWARLQPRLSIYCNDSLWLQLVRLLSPVGHVEFIFNNINFKW